MLCRLEMVIWRARATVWPCCIALETVRKPRSGGCFTNDCWWHRTSGNHVEATDGGNVVRGKHVNCSVSL